MADRVPAGNAINVNTKRGDNVTITFDPALGTLRGDDLSSAKAYFDALLFWQMEILDATVKALDGDNENDRMVFVEGVGEVSAREPSGIRAISFQEDLYERASDVMLQMMSKLTQIIEKTSQQASGT